MIEQVGQGRMPVGLQPTAISLRRSAGALVLVIAPVLSAAQTPPREQNALTGQPRHEASGDRQAEKTQREEGDAILALADAAMAGKPAPSDFAVQWQNDFVKAQRGTFVPFTLSVDASELRQRSALVYVRAVKALPTAARSGNSPRGSTRGEDAYPVDAIFPVELKPASDSAVRIIRGFSVEPGDYTIVVVLRERVDPSASRARPKASVVKHVLSVPDFRTGELTTSSVILADRLTVLNEPVASDRLAERPYAIGRNEVVPALDRRFGRDEELIVVFLVYNPMVTPERQFDVRVDYHFFRRVAGNASGERYFNRTDPQRFNPALMGATFDPATGEPVMAGQVVPLAGFEVGDYRLDVQVTDLLSGKSISRDVFFTVGS
jgi:hypothetical protein